MTVSIANPELARLLAPQAGSTQPTIKDTIIDFGGDMQSLNYDPGIAGWRIEKDGAAEFQEVVIRGEIEAGSGVFTGFIYVGTAPNRIVIDGAGKSIYSEDYTTNVDGWKINGDGSVEFQDGLFRGEIRAESGFFSGEVYVGDTINDRIIIDGTNKLLKSEDYDPGNAGWIINGDGSVEFQDGVFRGDLQATSGNFLDVVYVGASNPRIIIDGIGKVIKSENYIVGQSGWVIDSDGSAEFKDVTIRGTIKASVFTYNEINAIAGSQYILPSASTLLADTSTIPNDTVTTFTIDITDPESAHTQLFVVNDRLRIKDGVTGDTWLQVTAVSDQTTFYRYTVKRTSGTALIVYLKGTAVLDYGQSGDGGIWLNADSANGPFIQVFTHAGSPWSSITERVRIGNLNGWGPFSSDVFGFALGDYSGQSYIYFDPLNANTKMVNGGGSVTIDKFGLSLLEGTSTPNSIRWLHSGGVSVATLIASIGGGVGGLSIGAYGGAPGATEASFQLSAVGNSLDPVRLTLSSTSGGSKVNLSFGQPSVALLEIYPTGVQFWSGGSTLGGRINEFSTDGTLAGNSDAAVPTEKAVKTYADAITASTREKLTATRTYYVRTDGSDSNTGLVNSSGGAFLTIQKAIDVASGVDNGGFNITIQVGNGTYTGTNVLKSFVGSGKIIILGDASTPANVLVSTTSADCFGATSITGTYSLRGMELRTTTSGKCIFSTKMSQVEFESIRFGACAEQHIRATGGSVTCTGNYTVAGNAGAHMYSDFGGFLTVQGVTVTVSSTPAIATFAVANGPASIRANSTTYSGSATGARYLAALNGVIFTNGGGANYFPGNSAGSTATGGQYN